MSRCVLCAVRLVCGNVIDSALVAVACGTVTGGPPWYCSLADTEAVGPFLVKLSCDPVSSTGMTMQT